MNRDEALTLMYQYVQKDSLRKHMFAVEAAMRFYAAKFGEDVEFWGNTGLLHDFDFEIHPDLERHPSAGAPILREAGVPEEMVLAILSHGVETGVPRDNPLRKTLFACDEVTGLITAVALIRPSRSILDLKVSSVKKKWKNLNFAAGTSREEMEMGAQELGIELWEHVGNVIEAMRGAASELDLVGNPGLE
ncbi:HDIG domain-containing metalloprotein [Pelolinea submarina]|uniref:Metal dependent phosphohydrolase n=1 Tax=Pelolinea submarina TaxID=913107 RepID=A0A3E0AHE2_9CHLR|nr:HDIG domain-containing metalloprotein [Pelolinea submarina]REG11041.1 metal dependent phosphohydrolase [Pelolinea submarina]